MRQLWVQCRQTVCSVTKLTDSCIGCLQGSFPAHYHIQNTSQDSYCLDKNYQAFLLVDDGSVGHWGGETDFCASLEDYISHQRTGIKGETESCVSKKGSYLADRLIILCHPAHGCLRGLTLLGFNGIFFRNCFWPEDWSWNHYFVVSSLWLATSRLA